MEIDEKLPMVLEACPEEIALLSVGKIDEVPMALEIEMDGYEELVVPAAADVWNALDWLADG